MIPTTLTRKPVSSGDVGEPMSSLARIANGRETWRSDQRIPRHRHARGYAAVVLWGSYEECGNRGRFRVSPGDVLLHGAFDAHLDRFPRGGAHILNLVAADPAPALSLGRIGDPDAIARAAEDDPREALAQLREQLRPVQHAAQDWPDALARQLLGDPACRLEHWARQHGLRAETLSRGFRQVFGVTPAFFRAEARAHRAFGQIVGGAAPLAAIAADTGFADQAHMSRAVRLVTGLPPGAWRKSNPFKTGAGAAG
jgi:AraC-like DNA-binding protein